MTSKMRIPAIASWYFRVNSTILSYMLYDFSPYLLPSLISGMISLGLGIFTFSRRSVPGAYLFIAMMLLAAVWSFGYALSMASVSGSVKLLWYNLAQTGTVFTPVLWLLLVLQYTGYQRYIRRSFIPFMFLVPLSSYLLMWTNSAHHWLRSAVELTQHHYFTYLQIEHGFWFYIEAAYSYSMLLAAIWLLVKALHNTHMKGQVLVLLLSLLIPMFSSVLDILGLNPLKPYGPTSITFSISGLLIAFGLFRYRLFDIVPVARDKVFDDIADAVFVVDMRKRILDANSSGQQLVGKNLSELIGRDIEDVLPQLSLLFAAAAAGEHEKQGIETELKAGHFFKAEMSDLHINGPSARGNLIMLRNISEQKLREAELQQAYEEQSALLGELQHRVKNIMSSILSFVSIEMGRAENLHTKAVLEGLKHRIFAFSKLYELLHQSTVAGMVQLNEYIPAVVNALTRSFQAAERGIQVIVEVEKLRIEQKPATSIGLIVNELVTNSFKYGYTDGAHGLLRVKVRSEGEKIVLSVVDDGVGFPEDTEIGESAGVGLSLVELLTNQLKATLEIVKGENSAGVSFTIEIPFEDSSIE